MKERNVCFAGIISMALIAAVLVFFDQVTKSLAVSRLRDQPFPVIPGVFELRYVENRGAAFGLMKNGRFVFIVLGLLFLAACVLFLVRAAGKDGFLPLGICAAVLAAGDVGNLIDRFRLGYVRDFLYFRLIDFPVFNIADICVTCAGAAAMILVLFRYRDDEIASLIK